MSSQPTTPLLTGVINPYALAEVKVGHKIQWDNVANPRALLERILGHPYDRLFDPRYRSPLYAGLKYDAVNKITELDKTDPLFTARTMEEALVSVLERTGKIRLDEIAERTPRQLVAAMVAEHSAKTDAKVPLEAFEHIKKLTNEKSVNEILHVNPRLIDQLLNGFDWIDPGHFFTDAANPLDANQGALADCYFVAALASVAWAHPFTIAQRTRQTDPTGLFTTPGAVDLVLFWNTTTSAWDRIEATEQLPLQPPSNTYVYMRSDDPTESWPAVYEKAFAMWRTGDTSNQPDYTPIAFGDTVAAAVALTGLPGTYNGTAGATPHAIWQAVRSHSLSFKTFDPMMAWTYPSSAVAPTPINYDNATIVANHAYSILGWDYANGQEYIVLRNPWGNHEATLNVEGGTWYAFDGSFWYPVSLPSHGIFGLRSDTFQQYFQGYGAVSGADTFPAA